MSRKSLIQSLIDINGKGLEIGPSYNPIVPKHEGLNVEVLDYTSADALRAHYANDPNVDIDNIEEVDFISDGRSIEKVVGNPSSYDFIIASHVIEHVTDLVGFLQGAEALLKPTGSLLLAVPDKRRCFDINRPITTVGEVLDAHLAKRVRHTPGKAFDHIFYSASRAGAPVWTPETSADIIPQYSLALASQLFESAQIDGKYHDVHGWVFLPSSFQLIISTLNAMEKIGLYPDLLQPGDPHEFIVRMRIGKIPESTDFFELMEKCRCEETLP